MHWPFDPSQRPFDFSQSTCDDTVMRNCAHAADAMIVFESLR
jgi:hypothetical protein